MATGFARWPTAWFDIGRRIGDTCRAWKTSASAADCAATERSTRRWPLVRRTTSGPSRHRGVRLLEVDGKTMFRLPCAAAGAGCCTIYDNRPAICREVSCVLRRRYDDGKVSFDDARFLIASAIALRDRIRPQLGRFFDAPGPHALADLYRLMKAGVDGVEFRPCAGRACGIAARCRRPRNLLMRHFEPGRWNREEPPDLARAILRPIRWWQVGGAKLAHERHPFRATGRFGMIIAQRVAIAADERERQADGTVRGGPAGRSKHFSTKVELCRDALASGAPLRLRIRGTSMLPALWSGESVAVRPVEFADVRPGDLAVFVRTGHLVVHRVVRRTVGATGVVIVTRGDAQRHDDPPVDASELLGVVTAVHRFGASRPVRRRLPVLARGVAWTIQRSSRVRFVLDRLNSVLIGRAGARATVPRCENTPITGVRRPPTEITL